MHLLCFWPVAMQAFFGTPLSACVMFDILADLMGSYTGEVTYSDTGYNDTV